LGSQFVSVFGVEFVKKAVSFFSDEITQLHIGVEKRGRETPLPWPDVPDS